MRTRREYEETTRTRTGRFRLQTPSLPYFPKNLLLDLIPYASLVQRNQKKKEAYRSASRFCFAMIRSPPGTISKDWRVAWIWVKTVSRTHYPAPMNQLFEATSRRRSCMKTLFVSVSAECLLVAAEMPCLGTLQCVSRCSCPYSDASHVAMGPLVRIPLFINACSLSFGDVGKAPSSLTKGQR